jgi:hypothetical protein
MDVTDRASYTRYWRVQCKIISGTICLWPFEALEDYFKFTFNQGRSNVSSLLKDEGDIQCIFSNSLSLISVLTCEFHFRCCLTTKSPRTKTASVIAAMIGKLSFFYTATNAEE